MSTIHREQIDFLARNVRGHACLFAVIENDVAIGFQSFWCIDTHNLIFDEVRPEQQGKCSVTEWRAVANGQFQAFGSGTEWIVEKFSKYSAFDLASAKYVYPRAKLFDR